VLSAETQGRIRNHIPLAGKNFPTITMIVEIAAQGPVKSGIVSEKGVAYSHEERSYET
jgi:hypothetical protein